MMLQRFKVDVRRLLDRFQRRRDTRSAPWRLVPKGSSKPLVRLPKNMSEALQRLTDPNVINTLAFSVRSTSYKGVLSVDPEFRKFVIAFLKELHSRGLPFYVHTAFRSEPEQDAVFKAGRSRAKWGQSPHNYNLAVDIIHFRRGWDLTNAEWLLIGAIGQDVARKHDIDVVWGGDWDGDGDQTDQRLYDPAHWELAGWRDKISQNL